MVWSTGLTVHWDEVPVWIVTERELFVYMWKWTRSEYLSPNPLR